MDRPRIGAIPARNRGNHPALPNLRPPPALCPAQPHRERVMDDLLADFLTETNEGLVALDAALVRLERAPEDAATLSEVFRIVHTIKGTCGFLGLSRMESVAHAGENVLGRYRDGTL